MFRAHNTGSEATYTTYLDDTRLVAAASFRDQGPYKLQNVPAFVCLQD